MKHFTFFTLTILKLIVAFDTLLIGAEGAQPPTGTARLTGEIPMLSLT
jgi:hypothetical protein